MKKTESKVEHNDFTNAVKDHLIIHVGLLSPFHQWLPQRYILNHAFKRLLTCQELNHFKSTFHLYKINDC